MRKGKKHLNRARGVREGPQPNQFPKADELLEQAFHNTAKISVSRKGITPLKVIRNLNGLKIQSFGEFLQDRISNLSKQLPKIDQLDPFYLDLIGTLADLPRLKQNLAKLYASARIIKRLRFSYGKEAYTAFTIKDSNAALNALQGRVSSVVKKLRVPLAQLKEDSKKLRALPTIAFNLPSIV